MKLKKFALRGLIALAVTVALCMFFSRTVQTITTPKVQIIVAEKGRFEEKLSYSAQVYFQETQIITADNPYGMEVLQTHVQPGVFVHAGDPVFTLTLPGHDERKAALQAEYSTLSVRLMELDAANYGLPRETPLRGLYDAMVAANAALNEAVYAARFAELQNGAPPPEQVSEDVRTAREAYDAACAAYHACSAENPGSEAILAYLNARETLLADMDALLTQMLALDIAMTQANIIAAPHSGYITAVDAARLTYTISAEGCEPVLRCLAPGRTIAEGTRADITAGQYSSKRSSVISMTGSFLHIAIPEDMTRAIPDLMSSGAQVSITHRAKQATTLLPASALRSSGEDVYVYRIQYFTSGILSTKGMKVVKTPVTIIEQSGKTVSIAEYLEGVSLAVREDRPLSDGQTVMPYIN